MNGDLGQRAAYILSGLVDYYRYTGDAAAIAHIHCTAEALLDHCLTPDNHPWPRFLISVPTRGKPYGQADPHGFIQLDITAEVGVALVRASQLTGNTRWLEAARHWGDLLAEKRNRQPGVPPWGRYANPEDVPWEDQATGGVAFILEFFDALIRTGYTGKDDSILQARQAGIDYLRDVLLPDWTGPETWGRNYWDWPCPVQVENVTEFAARYLMEHPDEFPNWRNDTRNILSLFLNRTSVSPGSNGDVFSGAWAYPESSGCCGRSLWYGPMELASVYAQYGDLAGSEWGREMGRRQIILSTYDVHETGVVEDNIDGGQIVAGAWFKIAHPMALKHALAAMAWLPETLGPARENHIMRSTSVVTYVGQSMAQFRYQTADAPPGTVDVLRLAFRPLEIISDVQRLERRDIAAGNGYKVKELPNGDCIVTIRHDGDIAITVHGENPVRHMGAAALSFEGNWREVSRPPIVPWRVASEKRASASYTFTGNQVRLLGRYTPAGGRADVYLDGEQQLVGIDSWSPSERPGEVLYYCNGLSPGEHTLKVALTGTGNPLSKGTELHITGLQYSDAEGKRGFGQGGGPVESQRMIFGYSGRHDYIDSEGNAWRPGTEFVARAGAGVDSVAASWWTQRRRLHIAGTDDPELYRYGVHAREFWVDITVGPGTYHARLKFAETRNVDPAQRAMTILINGQEVVRDLDLIATAGARMSARQCARPRRLISLPAGLNRAVDLVFNDIVPANGVISIRFQGKGEAEAMVQAIEVGPGDGGAGATPVTISSAAPSP
jgi:hypothetical protein